MRENRKIGDFLVFSYQFMRPMFIIEGAEILCLREWSTDFSDVGSKI